MYDLRTTPGPTRCAACLTLATSLALGAAPSYGQSPRTDTVVVTGSALPLGKTKIGSSLTIISEDMIESQGYSYVPDALRQASGVSVSRAGASGALTQVRIRGAEANHTLVLLDGIDISSPDQGETDFSGLLTGGLARIEVLRGPQSGLYGSNALAGVINLVTRRALDGANARLALETGSFNTSQIIAGIVQGDGEEYAAADFQVLSSSGYDMSPDTGAAGIRAVGPGDRMGDPEGARVTTLYLRGGGRISPEFRLDGLVRFLDRQGDLDGQAYSFPIAGRTYDDASRTWQDQLLIGGSAELSLMGGAWRTIARISQMEETRRNTATDFPYFSGPTLPGDAAASLAAATLVRSGADTQRVSYGLQSTFEFGGPGLTSFLTGFIEYKREGYENPFTGRIERRSLSGIGAQYRIEFADQFYLSATARQDNNKDFEDASTYSIAASWVAPHTGLRPHASTGTGIANPTFFEQFGFDPGSFIGNPDLVPEKADGWDFGLEQTLFNGAITADLTYFESSLRHEIFTAFGPAPDFLSTPSNRASISRRRGWELSFATRADSDISLSGSYTFLDATEPEGVEARRPGNQAAIDATWRIGGGPLQVDLGLTHAGRRQDTDYGSYLRVRQSPYTLLRLGASVRLSDQTEIYARIENVMDTTYEEVIGYLGAPRGVFIGIRLRDDSLR